MSLHGAFDLKIKTRIGSREELVELIKEIRKLEEEYMFCCTLLDVEIG